MRTGRTDEGLKKLDEMIAKNPTNASAYAVKGQIYESQGKLPEAKSSYQAALKVDPNLAGAANNLAYILA
jgi:Flp pilus assembly protein TadD